MATHSATLDRDADGPVRKRPARSRRSGTSKAAKRRSPAKGPGVPGVWLRALRSGLAVTAVAFVAAVVVSLIAGHAPSWRSLSVVCLQSLPLLPGIALLWWLLERLRARFAALPLAFWLGLAFVGTLAVMLVVPGLVFAVHSRSMAFAEDHDGDMNLLHHLVGTAAALYLFATTAFRLWWPWGAALPALVTVLFWRAHRR
ncbi:hypothetical protein ACJ4V0_10710 [Phreatobacter sp. HK31-P]